LSVFFHQSVDFGVWKVFRFPSRQFTIQIKNAKIWGTFQHPIGNISDSVEYLEIYSTHQQSIRRLPKKLRKIVINGRSAGKIIFPRDDLEVDYG